MLGRTKKIHFVGIGGIGMSGIAELLLNQGFEVSGSDLQDSSIITRLRKLGAAINIGHNPALIKGSDVLVKSSAVRDSNPEVISAKQEKIPVIRRAEMLAEIMRMSYGIGIAGTHGKTTTTSMVGSILSAADLEPTVIVGGIVKNYGSNNLLGSGKYIVVEADEFDRSFLTLSPVIAGITNIDADHLDCYQDLAGIKEAFIEYANKVPFFGSIILCLDDAGARSIIPSLNKEILSYGLSPDAQVRAENISMKNFVSAYDLYHKNELLGRIELRVLGLHNILNSLMAVATGLELDIPFSLIKKGLADFNGVYRRFEFKGDVDGILVYDDYAHHPTEIQATLKGIKDSLQNKLVTVFQPHLYSRTRDFYEEFARSFENTDILIITPIFPAREEAIPGISGELIAEAARKNGKQDVYYAESEEQLLELINKHCSEGDILLTMGAGNIYQIAEKFLTGKVEI